MVATSFVLAPPARAAEPILVGASARVSAFADHRDPSSDVTIERSFTTLPSLFDEVVVANWSENGTERGRARQIAGLFGSGDTFARTWTRGKVESSFSRGNPEESPEACCGGGDAFLEVEVSIDAPTTVWVEGDMQARLQGRGCSEISLFSPSSGDQLFNVDEGVDCGTQDVPSERSLSEEINLDVAGNHTIQLVAETSAGRTGGPSSGGFAVWNLRFGFCSNEFTDGDDVLTGTPEDDVLCGGDGNDEIDGLGGKDAIFGGPGNDRLTGGPGDDTLEGSFGRDTLAGGDDNDFLFGGPGDDSGTAPDNEIRVLEGGGGSDTIVGEEGDDSLYSGAFIGSPDNANDTLSGGPGNDLVSAAGDTGVHTLEGNGGRDRIVGGDNRDIIDGGPGHESDTVDGIVRGIFGRDGNDIIRGGDEDDLIEGGSGTDELRGEAGSDKMRGQNDKDCLIGGPRKDVFVGGPDNDKLLARDGVRDELHGNGGLDRARIDNRDEVDPDVEETNLQGDC